MRGPSGLLFVMCVVLPGFAHAQVRPVLEWPEGSAVVSDSGGAGAATLQESASEAAHAVGLSLFVPGLGQHRQGRARKWLFGAVEVLGWAVFFERRASGNDLRTGYRDFAWSNGRLQAGSRVDGDFDYYETLTKWTRSGAFDSDPIQPGLQPEADAGSYNGTIWARAQGLFLGGTPGQVGDPGFEQARAYYEDNAYGSGFLWDWSDDAAGQAELSGRIEASDDRFRQATTVLGVVIANHLVSAVDAFLGRRNPSWVTPLDFGVAQGRTGVGWSARLHVPVGR